MTLQPQDALKPLQATFAVYRMPSRSTSRQHYLTVPDSTVHINQSTCPGGFNTETEWGASQSASREIINPWEIKQIEDFIWSWIIHFFSVGSYLPQILRTNKESSTTNSITESSFSCLFSNKSSSWRRQTEGVKYETWLTSIVQYKTLPALVLSFLSTTVQYDNSRLNKDIRWMSQRLMIISNTQNSAGP